MPKFHIVNRWLLEVPLPSGSRLLCNISVSSRTQSRTNFGFDPMFDVPGYSLVNGLIGLKFSRYEVSLFGSNLLNKYYFNTVQATGDNVTRITGQPMTFGIRSEEHTSELQSLMRISYAVFCLKKKNIINLYYSI